jgi:hypothetical protein
MKSRGLERTRTQFFELSRQVLAHRKDEVRSIREDKDSPLRFKTSIDLCRNHPPNIGELLYQVMGVCEARE